MTHGRFSFLGFVGKTLYALLFVCSSGVIIASANGYLFDRTTFRFEETGIINLTVDQSPVTVTLNEKEKVYKRSEINLSYLLPGWYTVEVAKPGYRTWSRTIRVTQGEVVLNPFVELFLAESEPRPATSSQTSLLQEMEFPTYDSELDIRGNEIWAKPISRTYPFQVAADRFDLVGRFISPIHSAQWLPGKTHILFHLDNEIRVMDRDGRNDLLLATLTTSAPTRFTTINDGRTLAYQDGDQYLQKPIQ